MDFAGKVGCQVTTNHGVKGPACLHLRRFFKVNQDALSTDLFSALDQS